MITVLSQSIKQHPLGPMLSGGEMTHGKVIGLGLSPVDLVVVPGLAKEILAREKNGSIGSRKRWLLAAISVWMPFPAFASDYYNQKWFDYPDLGTAPRITVGCAHEACTKIPETHGFRIEWHQHCVCTNPTQRTDLLRRDVRVIVSGPDTADQSVRNALVGYAGGCVAAAIAASTAGPQVVASPAGFFASFKACIAAISVSGIVGSILNQFDIRFDTSGSHWSPL